MILDVQHVSISFGLNEVLKDASFHLEEHEKAALVGINGAGKSTMLKIIMQQLEPDSGRAVLSRDCTLGYLAQRMEIPEDLTIYDQLLSVKADVLELENRIRSSELKMKTLSGSQLDNEMERYARMSEEFERAGGYALRSEASGVLKGLGFAEEDFGKKAAVLSGGQKTRVALGTLLLSSPDLILLDEPTNHLDLPSITWLETYLQNYKGAVLVVSHDRYFLNRIVSKVIEIERGELFVCSGTYDDYSRKKADAYHAACLAYMKAEKERRHQEEVIRKLESFNREKSIKRAESRKKMLDRMEMPKKPLEEAADMQFRVRPRFESGNDVLSVSGLSKSFDGRSLFADLSFAIRKGERVALIGSNGTGKSTILKIINRLLAADTGEITLGAHAAIGYYDQEMQVLHMEKTIFQEISDDYPTLNNTQIRSALAAFLFTGEDVFKLISSLSGGECARVSLAKLMLSEANFLILDEPTNHLDIQSKEILENALCSYEGTVLYVSHDRYFINRTATRILELNSCVLTSSMGNYDDYCAKKADPPEKEGTSSAPAEPATAAKTDWLTKKANEARIRKRRADIEKAEMEISALEKQDKETDRKLQDPAAACDPVQCAALSSEKEDIAAKLEELYNRWNELQEEED